MATVSTLRPFAAKCCSRPALTRPAAARKAAGITATRHQHQRLVCAASSKGQGVVSPPFPSSYESLVVQAQRAVRAAIDDGHLLIELEFPPGGLETVAGKGALCPNALRMKH